MDILNIPVYLDSSKAFGEAPEDNQASFSQHGLTVTFSFLMKAVFTLSLFHKPPRVSPPTFHSQLQSLSCTSKLEPLRGIYLWISFTWDRVGYRDVEFQDENQEGPRKQGELGYLTNIIPSLLIFGST